MLTQDKITKNAEVFKSKFQQYVGAISDDVIAKIGKSSWEIKNENNCAYDGSLLQVVLYTLIPTAIKINDTLPEPLRASTHSLIKTLLVQHIGKAEMFVPNTNTWEVQKLGKVYTYNNNLPGIKLGALSYVTAINLGCILNTEEFEAITIIDRSEDDWQAKLHVSTLSHVVRIANELTNVIITKQNGTN